VVSITRGNNLGGDAGVVAVAFDQRGGPRGLSDPAFRLIRAGVLRILRHPHFQLWRCVDQRLGRVVADERLRTVQIAVLIRFRNVGSGDRSRKMFRQRLVAFLLLFAPVSADFDKLVILLFLIDRLLQTVRSVADFRAVSEVQLQLLRAFQILSFRQRRWSP